MEPAWDNPSDSITRRSNWEKVRDMPLSKFTVGELLALIERGTKKHEFDSRTLNIMAKK